MNTFILILILVFILWTFFRNWIIYNRTNFYHKIIPIYDRMELEIIKNNIIINNDIAHFLKIHKQFVVNYDLADIQVFASILSENKISKIEESKIHFEKIKQILPIEVIKLSNEFNTYIDKSIIFSLLKPDFLMFVAKYAIYQRITSLKIIYHKIIWAFFK